MELGTEAKMEKVEQKEEQLSATERNNKTFSITRSAHSVSVRDTLTDHFIGHAMLVLG